MFRAVSPALFLTTGVGTISGDNKVYLKQRSEGTVWCSRHASYGRTIWGSLGQISSLIYEIRLSGTAGPVVSFHNLTLTLSPLLMFRTGPPKVNILYTAMFSSINRL